jgi:citrate lyase subunit beta/citryl-CoA lyase
MSDIVPRRSVLYVPADKPRAIAKARTLPVDAVILDLEDSVAPEKKAEAREALRSALAEPFACDVAVRVNPLDTEWATEDILAAIAARTDALLVPKVEGPGTLQIVADALTQSDAPEAIEIWAMIETPKSLLHLAAIAGLAASVMNIAAAARSYELDLIDGPCNDFRDLAKLEAECVQARSLGMDGKSLIHPDQVPTANRVFAPTDAECAEARSVVAAFARPENQNRAVISSDGRMLERLHLLEAERVLVLAAAIERAIRESRNETGPSVSASFPSAGFSPRLDRRAGHDLPVSRLAAVADASSCHEDTGADVVTLISSRHRRSVIAPYPHRPSRMPVNRRPRQSQSPRRASRSARR